MVFNLIIKRFKDPRPSTIIKGQLWPNIKESLYVTLPQAKAATEIATFRCGSHTFRLNEQSVYTFAKQSDCELGRQASQFTLQMGCTICSYYSSTYSAQTHSLSHSMRTLRECVCVHMLDHVCHRIIAL